MEPADLVLDETKLHQSGVSLVCSSQDPDHFVFTKLEVVLKKENICALLCNYHHVLTIKSLLQPDGSSAWWVVRPGGGAGGEEAVGKDGPGATNIYCW